MSTKTLPVDRTPEPVTRFTGDGENRGFRIDGGNTLKEENKRARKGDPPTVPAEIAADQAPGAALLVLLDGGPHGGLEARVPRSAVEHRVPSVRTEPAERTPEMIAAKIYPGDFQQALYLRSDRRSDDGRPVFEFAGVE
jgi:hypothetical protein